MRSISSEMSKIKNHCRIRVKIQIHTPFGFFIVEFHRYIE